MCHTPSNRGGDFRSDLADPALVRCFNGPDQESWREVGSLLAGYFCWALVPEIFGFVRTFAPKNSAKIAANVEKTALCRRLYNEDSADIPKPIRPIMSRPHGLKVFPAKNFRFESLWAGFFSAQNLKILKIFRSKVEK